MPILCKVASLNREAPPNRTTSLAPRVAPFRVASYNRATPCRPDRMPVLSPDQTAFLVLAVSPLRPRKNHSLSRIIWRTTSTPSLHYTISLLIYAFEELIVGLSLLTKTVIGKCLLRNCVCALFPKIRSRFGSTITQVVRC